ncbi:MAG: CCA tRNA nucleotidyltransferase [Pseudomonadota bacterium]
MMPRDNFAWVSDSRLQAVFSALHAEGEARLVGGCVRDSLLGLKPLEQDGIDIDIATTLNPEEMSIAFQRSGIKWVATGAAHGTLTAVIGGLVCECTSLRSDVVTDGRHAEVAFTRDWDLDWRRRDFTINALYADRLGEVWDPTSGLQDLNESRVRFIGAAKDRIREDALRILRFFRFSARFSDGFDEEALTAIAAATPLIDRLSKERIWSELSRILSAERAPSALATAERVGVLSHIIDQDPDLAAFEGIHRLKDAPAALGVAALWPQRSNADLRAAFKPPADFLTEYQLLEKAAAEIRQGTTAVRLLYRYGRDTAGHALRLAKARGTPFDTALTEQVGKHAVPVLPLSGKDLVEGGIPPGEKVGAILRDFEEEWLQADASDDADILQSLLDAVLSRQATS